MQTATHGNDNGLNDLYVLPETHDERVGLEDFLAQVDTGRWEFVRADVEGHPWYGKWFYVLPFREDLEPTIRKAICG